MGFVPNLLKAGLKVIDFSADYRIKDVDVYENIISRTRTEKISSRLFTDCAN
jgi:N-acetyl-gamma-glutamylphosphate reductase